ncbi:MAG TPA: DUF6746 family protein [Pseudomonas sp.]|jgi:hypothetical protein|uniref:DUF6746 family protein n=1 Tax=Pseudomonas sp. TaxID=306 RepID=UPI002C4A6DAB|nr:DUF6746 family protein [Pseudomonas sp.]HTO18388.1 DUF6746 family protein [Pseudomonas sp.]
MNAITRTVVFTLATCLSAGALASERMAHAKGLPADTLAEAVSNLASHNQKLEALIAQPMTPQQLGEVHLLSYTLENALRRIDHDLKQIAENLEAVHIASESNDPATVQRQGRAYLDGVRPLAR